MKGERDTLSLHQSRAEQSRTDDEEEEEWGVFILLTMQFYFVPHCHSKSLLLTTMSMTDVNRVFLSLPSPPLSCSPMMWFIMKLAEIYCESLSYMYLYEEAPLFLWDVH